MADEKLIFDILQGQNTLQKGLDQAAKTTSGIEKELKGLGSALPKNIFGGVFAADLATKGIELITSGLIELVGVFGTAINEANKSEKAIRGLDAALRANGATTDASLNSLIAFADEIEALTGINDDVTISNLSLLRSLTNLNDKGLKTVFVAASDLAAGLKIDLDSAIQLVAKAANGNVAALNRYNLGIKEGSTNADTLANTLERLNQFQGRAAKDAEGYNGALSRLGNANEDFLKALGQVIIKSPAVIELLNDLAGAVNSITAGLPKMVDFFSKAFTNIGRFSLAFGGVKSGAVKDATENTGKLTESLDKATKSAKDLKKESANIFQAQKPVDLSKDQLKSINDLAATAKKITLTNIKQSLDFEQDEKIRKLNEIVGIGVKLNKAAALEVEAAKFAIGREFDQKRVIQQATELKVAAGIAFSGLAQGAAGARAVLGSVLDKVADSLKSIPFVGVFAGIVSEALKFFSQGKDAVRQQTRDFIQALSKLPSDILQAIPVFISELVRNIGLSLPAEFAKNAPAFVTALINELIPQLPTLIPALQKAFIDASIALQLAMPQIAIAFVTGIIANLPALVRGLIQSYRLAGPFLALTIATELIKQAPSIAAATAQAFVEAFKEAARGFGDFGGAGSNIAQGAGNAIQSIGDFLGFADGGLVPGNPARGDSVPALLTPGEAVLPTSIVDKIDRIASNQGAPQMITVILQMGEQQLATAILNLSRQGFRTTI